MRKNRSTAAAGALLLLCTGGHAVSADSLETIRARGVIEVAVYADMAPYSLEADGQAAGIDVAIGRALADKLGVALKVRLVRADESLGDDLRNQVWKGHYLGGGTADLMMHVPVDPALAKDNEQVTILAPYHRETIAVALHPRLQEVVSLDQLEGEKIGAEKLTLASDYLALALGGQLRDGMVLFRSVPEAAAALREGVVSAVMAPRGEIEGALASDGKEFRVRTLPLPRLPYNGWDLGVALKASDTELARAVDEAVGQLRADGSLKRIFEDHGLAYEPPSVRKM